jgi:hypothetical protein
MTTMREPKFKVGQAVRYAQGSRANHADPTSPTGKVYIISNVLDTYDYKVAGHEEWTFYEDWLTDATHDFRPGDRFRPGRHVPMSGSGFNILDVLCVGELVDERDYQPAKGARQLPVTKHEGVVGIGPYGAWIHFDPVHVGADADVTVISDPIQPPDPQETNNMANVFDPDAVKLTPLLDSIEKLRTGMFRTLDDKSDELAGLRADLRSMTACYTEQVRHVANGRNVNESRLRQIHKAERKAEAAERELTDKVVVIGRQHRRIRDLQGELVLEKAASQRLIRDVERYMKLYEDGRSPIYRIGNTLLDGASVAARGAVAVVRAPIRAPLAVAGWIGRRVAATWARTNVKRSVAYGFCFGNILAFTTVGLCAAPRLYERYLLTQESPAAANPADPRERAWMDARDRAQAPKRVG